MYIYIVISNHSVCFELKKKCPYICGFSMNWFEKKKGNKLVYG